ncbi:unnamed protein product, partial [marine sediment metagenome]
MSYKKLIQKNIAKKISISLFICLITAFLLFPLFWMIMTS